MRPTHNNRGSSRVFDTSKVLKVLREAHGIVEADWGSANTDLPFDEAAGWGCASLAISAAAGNDVWCATSLTAHRLFLTAAGVEIPESEAAIVGAVYAFNDAQESRQPVLDAFDRAIEIADETEPTPNADSTLAVIAACERAGAVVAQEIVAECPDLNEALVAEAASSELFYAAQDIAQGCFGSVVDR